MLKLRGQCVDIVGQAPPLQGGCSKLAGGSYVRPAATRLVDTYLQHTGYKHLPPKSDILTQWASLKPL
jgi:hypothetical protein